MSVGTARLHLLLDGLGRAGRHPLPEGLARSQYEVVVGQEDEAQREGDDGGLAEAVGSPQVLIPSVELPDHPGAVGRDPEGDGDVVQQFGEDLARPPGDEEGHRHGRNDHDQGGDLEIQRPAGILDQPEEDVHVLDPPEAEGDAVDAGV